MTRLLMRGGRTLVDGRIVAADVVVDDATLAHVGPPGSGSADVAVELSGALVLPAFVDGHVHATDTGLVLTGLDLSGARSRDDVLDAVAARTRSLRGRPVLGHGWDETAWPDRTLPTAAELDRASYGSLVYLSRVDVHSALVSGALLATAPAAARADGYDADGWVRREAHHVVREVALASVTPAQRAEAQRHMLRTAAAHGIAHVHEMNGPGIGGEDDLRTLLEVAADPALPDVVAYWGQTAADGGLEALRDLGAHGLAGDLFVDGALGSRTAHLRSPYADADTRGALYLDADAVADHLVRCSVAGVQAGFHVIGDAAMDVVADGLVAAAAVAGRDRVRALHHRLEHAEMLDARHVSVLADLEVVASVQPAFDAAWGGPSGMYVDRLGPERGVRLNPYADLAAAGVALVLGSDAPVTPLDPWGTVRAAVRHRTPGQGLPVADAFRAHTAAAHRAVGAAPVDALRAGGPATFAVWRAGTGEDGWPDPDSPPPTCVRTVLRGTILHDSGDLEEVAA